MNAQGEAVEQRFAALLAAGVPAHAPEAAAAAEDHRAWVGRFYDCSHEVQSGLADLYLADERFRAHYDDRAPGLAQYVHDAVKANAAGR